MAERKEGRLDRVVGFETHEKCWRATTRTTRSGRFAQTTALSQLTASVVLEQLPLKRVARIARHASDVQTQNLIGSAHAGTSYGPTFHIYLTLAVSLAPLP